MNSLKARFRKLRIMSVVLFVVAGIPCAWSHISPVELMLVEQDDPSDSIPVLHRRLACDRGAWCLELWKKPEDAGMEQADPFPEAAKDEELFESKNAADGIHACSLFIQADLIEVEYVTFVLESGQFHSWTLVGLAQITHASGKYYDIVIIPFELPAAATALFLVIVWFPRRPKSDGHCRQCNYNLTGNTSGRCPECGTGVATK